MNMIKLNKIPSGTQIHVAIMSHTGYNQEDSVLINKGSIDRGLFAATIYHTEKDEDKNIIRDEIIRCKPNPAKTKSVKFGNYDKLSMTRVMFREIFEKDLETIKEIVIFCGDSPNDLHRFPYACCDCRVFMFSSGSRYFFDVLIKTKTRL